MGTKKEPGKFDCYEKAKDDEPMFTLLARDPMFAYLVNLWAENREKEVVCGERPNADMELVGEARQAASRGQEWRKKNIEKRRSSGHW